jgi:hypothetical protein
MCDQRAGDLAPDGHGGLLAADDEHDGFYEGLSATYGRLFDLDADGSLTSGPNGYPAIDQISLQPDGDVVLAGGAVLQRHLPDWTLDKRFGQGGVARLPRVRVGLHTRAMATDSRGRYLVLADNSLGRFTAAGQLDRSFGTCGFVSVSRLSAPYAMVIRPGGSIVIAGDSQQPSAGGPAPGLVLVAVRGARPENPGGVPHFVSLATSTQYFASRRRLLAGEGGFAIESPQRARATITLRVPAKAAARYGRHFPRVLATAHARLRACHITVPVFTPTRSAVRALRRLPRSRQYRASGLPLRITATLSDAAGSSSRSFREPSLSDY